MIEVVLHLGQVAHAAEHHLDALKGGGKPDRVAGRAAALQPIQLGGGLGGQGGQAAALHRLHHDHRLAEPPADLVHAMALDAGVLIVGIVELDLHHLHLGVLGEHPGQEVGFVMEGKADVPDLSLRLELLQLGEGVAAAKMVVVVGGDGMQQVNVEILHPAGGQLAFEQRADVRLGLEKAAAELVGKPVGMPRVAAGQAGAQGGLTLAVQVAVGGVKVAEPPLQKPVHHAADLVGIHGVRGAVVLAHRQAHHAKAQFFRAKQ